jgi:hypothetical protein
MDRQRSEDRPDKPSGTTKDEGDRAMDAVREVVENEGDGKPKTETDRKPGGRAMDAVREIVEKEK